MVAARGQEKRIPFPKLQILQVAKDSRHDELALLPAKRVGKLKLANVSRAGLLPLRLPQRPHGKADQTGGDMGCTECSKGTRAVGAQIRAPATGAQAADLAARQHSGEVLGD